MNQLNEPRAIVTLDFKQATALESIWWKTKTNDNMFKWIMSTYRVTSATILPLNDGMRLEFLDVNDAIIFKLTHL